MATGPIGVPQGMEGDPFPHPVVPEPRILQDALVVGEDAVGLAPVVLEDGGTATQHQGEQPSAQEQLKPYASEVPPGRHPVAMPRAAP